MTKCLLIEAQIHCQINQIYLQQILLLFLILEERFRLTLRSLFLRITLFVILKSIK